MRAVQPSDATVTAASALALAPPLSLPLRLALRTMRLGSLCNLYPRLFEPREEAYSFYLDMQPTVECVDV